MMCCARELHIARLTPINANHASKPWTIPQAPRLTMQSKGKLKVEWRTKTG